MLRFEWCSWTFRSTGLLIPLAVANMHFCQGILGRNACVFGRICLGKITGSLDSNGLYGTRHQERKGRTNCILLWMSAFRASDYSVIRRAIHLVPGQKKPNLLKLPGNALGENENPQRVVSSNSTGPESWQNRSHRGLFVTAWLLIFIRLRLEILSGSSFPRHPLLEFFKPVQDDADFRRGSECGCSGPELLHHQELLAIRADVPRCS